MNTIQRDVSSGSSQTNCLTNSNGLACQYSMSSVLLMFGVGMGVGVAIGNWLGGPVMTHSNLRRRTEHMAEQLGRQMLQSLAGVLPESIAKHVSA